MLVSVATRDSRWMASGGRVGLVLGLALMAWALASGPPGGSSSAIAARRGAHASARLQALPLQAQSQISGEVGATQSEFTAGRAAGGFRLEGGGVAATLGRGGARIVGGGSVSMALEAVGRGARLGHVGDAVLSSRKNRVMYRYRGVTAWYEAGPLGIEQGFIISRRPRGSARLGPPGGSLTLALDLAGSLSARRTGAGVRFLTRSGRLALWYRGLSAVDAAGRALPARLELAHGRLLVLVRDEGARYPVRIDPLLQLGQKVLGTGERGSANFGNAVAVAGDGNTALIGGPNDNGKVGAAWVFVRTGSNWVQQAKLTATGESGASQLGFSVALSSDGNTALVGGESDASSAGAAWVFTRTGSTWAQQAKLTGAGESGAAVFGFSVALSSDGSTALVGGVADNADHGAAWAFSRAGSTWSPLGGKLTPSDEVGAGLFGTSVSLSGDGSTALIGGEDDNSGIGAAWVFARSAAGFGQLGTKLTAGGEVGAGLFGDWVALSADGSTALIGGFLDNNGAGAAWVFTRSGSGWSQLGSKLVPSDETGEGRFGVRAAVSADGSAALIGGYLDNSGVGAAWLFTRSGSVWTQQGAKLTGGGEAGAGEFGFAVGLSSDGATAVIGGVTDDGNVGGAWVFGYPLPTCANTTATTAVGGGTVVLALQCSGPAGVALAYGIVTGPAHGTLGPINQATGTVSYTPSSGYSGSDGFTYQATDPGGASNAATATITIPRALVRLNSTISLNYRYTPGYTQIRSLSVNGVPGRARVHVSCRGRRCPYKSRVSSVPRRRVCRGKGKKRRCQRKPPPRSGSVNLTPSFQHRDFPVATKITITITEAGAIAKVWIITVRRAHAPSIRATCLAPGSKKLGQGC